MYRTVLSFLPFQHERVRCKSDISLYISHLKIPYEQRVGRAYRLGQTSDVHAYNFICKDTVEEVIYENFKEKQKVITVIIKNLDNKDIVGMEELKKYESKLYLDIEKEMCRK